MSVSESTPSIIASAKDVLASIVGSAACVYSGQPFDTIKVRMQVQPGFFLSPVAAIKLTLQDEGLFALWRGSVPAFVGALGENAMAFGVNGLLKRLLIERKSDTSTAAFYEPFATGAITGTFIPFVLCPCDVLKCRAQMNRASGQNSSLKFVLLDLYRRQGLRGLYVGYQIQLFRDILFYSSFFGTYDVACKQLKKHTNLSDPVVYFIGGGLSGQVAWLLSIAADTVKSRIQTSNEATPPTIRSTVRSIIASQGIKGFFRGVEVAVVRAFPANAALFVGYEITRGALDKLIPS